MGLIKQLYFLTFLISSLLLIVFAGHHKHILKLNQRDRDMNYFDRHEQEIQELKQSVEKVLKTQEDNKVQIGHLNAKLEEILTNVEQFNQAFSSIDEFQQELRNLEMNISNYRSNEQPPSSLSKYSNIVHNMTQSLEDQSTAIRRLENQFEKVKHQIHHLQRHSENSGEKKFSVTISKSEMSLDMLKAQVDGLQDVIKIILSSTDDSKTSNLTVNKCMPPFIHHLSSCYYFVNASKTWPVAERHCQTIHPKAHLVGIETQEEQDFLISYRKHNAKLWGSNYLWIGANNEDSDFKWVGSGRNLSSIFQIWEDGKTSFYTRGQPIDGTPHETLCAYYNENHPTVTWVDWPCTKAHLNYICEIML